MRFPGRGEALDIDDKYGRRDKIVHPGPRRPPPFLGLSGISGAKLFDYQ